MEYWDHWRSIWLKKNTAHGRNKPWIEKTLVQVLKLCVFDHYSMIPLFHHSIRPTKRMIAKSTVISMNCRNSDTSNYCLQNSLINSINKSTFSGGAIPGTSQPEARIKPLSLGAAARQSLMACSICSRVPE
jgi:hypothetical protein